MLKLQAVGLATVSFLALALGVGPAAAATSVSLGGASASPGSVASVPVNFSTTDQVTALQLDVVFDAAKLTPGTPTAGAALSGHDHEVDSNVVSTGRLRIVVISQTTQVIPNGVIVNIPFTVGASVASGVSLTLEGVETVDTTAAVVPSATDSGPGISTGGACVQGDLSGDGNVGLVDFLLGRRKILGSVASAPRDLQCGNLHPGAEVCVPQVGKRNWCSAPDGIFGIGDVLVIRRMVSEIYQLSCTACAPSVSAPGLALNVAGDVAPPNVGDGQVTVNDVVLALRWSVGLDSPSAQQRLGADVAPATRVGGETLATGNGSVDVGDVVLLLRAAVGLEQLKWPERTVVAHLEDVAPHVAFRVTLLGVPPGLQPVGADAPDCAGDAGSSLDTAGDRWAVTCASDPAVHSGPSDLVTFRYRGPRLDASGLTLHSELTDARLADVAGHVSILQP